MSSSQDTAFRKAVGEIQARAREFYPSAKPHTEGFIKVDDIHTVWWGQYGNPDGVPCLASHGGPGGSCSGSSFERFFDLTKWNLIVWDQRGCGKSTPHACVENNTQWHSIKDIIKILDHLKVDKAVIFGGSWGSTLSLTFAESYPERCLGLILRGIFTLRRHELEFLYQKGACYVFPEFWEQYIAPIPENERDDYMLAYHKRLFNDDDKKTQLLCAKTWSVWEGATCMAVPEISGASDKYSEDHFALSFARIENQYFVNRGFWPDGNENWLFDNAHKITKDIPVFAVHGRYDMVCVYEAFYQLRKVIPHGEFVIAPLSGHSSSDPDIMSILLNATDKYADMFKHLIKSTSTTVKDGEATSQ